MWRCLIEKELTVWKCDSMVVRPAERPLFILFEVRNRCCALRPSGICRALTVCDARSVHVKSCTLIRSQLYNHIEDARLFDADLMSRIPLADLFATIVTVEKQLNVVEWIDLVHNAYGPALCYLKDVSVDDALRDSLRCAQTFFWSSLEH